MDATVVIGVRCSGGVGPALGGRESNQDNFLVALDGTTRWLGPDGEEVVRETDGHGVMVAVADGMGGHDQGEVASAAAVQALAKLWSNARPTDPERTLMEWVPLAHDGIRKALGGDSPINMGTTLTVAWFLGDQLAWVHVGDSRLYILRHTQLRQVSLDQTHAEFARRDRRVPGANAAWPAQSFIYGSRGLGMDGQLRLDPGLDGGVHALTRGERVLLCSDGLSNFLGDAEITRRLARAPNAQKAADDLVEAAMDADSDDNLTALVIDVRKVPWGRSRATTLDPSGPDSDDTLVPD